MEYVVYALVFLGLVILIFGKNAYDEKKKFNNIVKNLASIYGKAPRRKYETGEMERIKLLYDRYCDENSIDDISANDIDLESVFQRMNYCVSSMGSEFLYYRLRTPVEDETVLNENEKKIAFFQENEDMRSRFLSFYIKIGKLRTMGFYDWLDFFDKVPMRNLWKDYISFLVMAIGILLLFFVPALGIVVLLAFLVYNIISYYILRGEIENYIVIFGYIINFVNNSREICKINADLLSADLGRIKEITDELRKLTEGSSIVTGNQVSAVGIGNPVEMIFDYARMLFHIDIIRFYHMLEQVKKNTDKIDELYYRLGQIESFISIAYFRASLEEYCIPQRSDKLSMTDGYHPLIDKPVKNSIVAEKGVLITGSNASGKSTFLKTVALNVLLANTVHTCCAHAFSNAFVHLFSSMSLRDSLKSSDSYFMVEIKAIKRILDYSKENPDKKILCFVDEVLRGTNTVERIAAGCEILKSFTGSNITCFAATHDGELTLLLENIYDNYHFDEEISNNDVIFNYRIKDGRATSKNAIKLLSVLGYDQDIVTNAENLAQHFVESGEWK